MNIAANLVLLKQEITELSARYQRAPNSVQLLAVSKGQPASAIETAYAAGQQAFGENYLQEALLKIATLKELAIEWHYIGSLQRNKTKKIAENFAWVHTVDNVTIAERLHEQRPTHLPPINICLQINISNDANKSGCSAAEAFNLAQSCKNFPHLKLRGLMAIPEQKKSFADQRAELHKMFELFQDLSKKGIEIDTLSMGMSDDLAAAIAEGSTMVRIGTKIFGKRF